MKLIIGLGNPGKEYEKTRHNVGFLTLDNYLGNVKWKSKFNGLYYENDNVVYIKPTTYMNLSGNCVRDFVNFYKVDIDDILIIQDDLDLPLFSYKLKYKSSSGGHNGIKSIISNLGTDCIPRLKIGITNNKDMDTKDYVLGNLSKKDQKIIFDNQDTYNKIIEEFDYFTIHDLMNKYNRK